MWRVAPAVGGADAGGEDLLAPPPPMPGTRVTAAPLSHRPLLHGVRSVLGSVQPLVLRFRGCCQGICSRGTESGARTGHGWPASLSRKMKTSCPPPGPRCRQPGRRGAAASPAGPPRSSWPSPPVGESGSSRPHTSGVDRVCPPASADPLSSVSEARPPGGGVSVSLLFQAE